MQLLAMLTMLIDHTGIVFFPENPWFRCAGRLAMPLYAHALVLGYGRTRSFRRYALRLAAVAVLSQLPYQFALTGPDETFEFNVVFTLLVSLALLRLTDIALSGGSVPHPSAGATSARDPLTGPAARFAPDARRFIAAMVPAAAGCLLLELVPFDYGAYLLLLVLIYRFTRGQVAVALHFFLTALYVLNGFPAYQMFSLIATLLVACAPDAQAALNRRFRVPRWLWLSFYPAHLAALAAIRPFLPV